MKMWNRQGQVQNQISCENWKRLGFPIGPFIHWTAGFNVVFYSFFIRPVLNVEWTHLFTNGRGKKPLDCRRQRNKHHIFWLLGVWDTDVNYTFFTQAQQISTLSDWSQRVLITRFVIGILHLVLPHFKILQVFDIFCFWKLIFEKRFIYSGRK